MKEDKTFKSLFAKGLIEAGYEMKEDGIHVEPDRDFVRFQEQKEVAAKTAPPSPKIGDTFISPCPSCGSALICTSVIQDSAMFECTGCKVPEKRSDT